MRNGVLVATVGLGALLGAGGCGARSAMRPGDGAGDGGNGSGGATTSNSGTSSASASSASGEPSIWGTVWLVHEVQEEYAYESLSLHGAFFAEDYHPELPPGSLVASLETPDGVPCDIYYASGGVPDDPPPDPPPEIDAGHLSCGVSPDLLGIDFEIAHYSMDWRSSDDPGHPLPAWLGPGAPAVTFSGAGSAAVAAFTQATVLPAAPAILWPPPGEKPTLPEPDGNYRIAWQPAPANQTIVSLGFNLDWDDSVFYCRPGPTATELRLPPEWLAQWTWGSGVLTVSSLDEVDVAAGVAAVRLLTGRQQIRNVSFAGW